MRLVITVLLAACGGDDMTEPRSCSDFDDVFVYRDSRGALECAFEFPDGETPRIFPDGSVQDLGYPKRAGRFWNSLAWGWDGDEGKAGTVVRVGDDRCRWVRASSSDGAVGEGGACAQAPGAD